MQRQKGRKWHRFSSEMFQTQKGPEPEEIRKRGGQGADGQGEREGEPQADRFLHSLTKASACDRVQP